MFRTLRKLALSGFVLALCVVALELLGQARLGEDFDYGRILGDHWRICAQYDSEMGWSNRPGARGRVATHEFAYSVEINSSGQRDPEHDLLPAAGVKRLVLLGDSLTWGWGTDNEHRFCELLDDQLDGLSSAANANEIEVLNFAVPGYGTDQQFWTLTERAASYEPNAVLLVFVLNDLLEVEQTKRYGMGAPRFVQNEGSPEWSVENRPVERPYGAVSAQAKQLGLWLCARSAFWQWIWLRNRPEIWTYLENQRSMEVYGEGAGEMLNAAPESYRQPSPKRLGQIEELAERISDPTSRTHMLLASIKQACDERGWAFGAVAVAHKHDQYLYEPNHPLPPGLDPEQVALAPDEFTTVLSRHLIKAGAMLDFPVASVDAAMLQACRAGQSLHCGDGHLNVLGNQVVADALEPFLVDLLGLTAD